MFALLLFRRFGLAIGAFLFTYFLLAIADRIDDNWGKHLGMALGASIVAFFLPRIMARSKPFE
jgi:hypothetical protein